MTIYTLMSQYEPVPRATFVDYHTLIMYVRKHCCDTHKIYQSLADSWNEFNDVTEISESVYANAYNGFEHYKDKNYEQTN